MVAENLIKGAIDLSMVLHLPNGPSLVRCTRGIWWWKDWQFRIRTHQFGVKFNLIYFLFPGENGSLSGGLE